MRLADFEIKAIMDNVRQYDKDAQVYLFGSRTDDKKKGGDIDLIIISDKINKNDLTHLEWNLFNSIEERKIDILLSTNKTKDKFIRLAIKNAVAIC